MRNRRQSGFTLVIAIVIALILGITVTVVAKLISSNTHQAVYFTGLTNAYRLAETGMNKAISQLIRTPNLVDFPTTPVSVPDQNGIYENHVELRDKPLQGTYYIVTSATRTVNGRKFSTRLHTYTRVSNVGEYFAAVNGFCPIQAGADLSSGRIYALEINFTDALPKTNVLRAEFIDKVTPPLLGNNDWPAATKANINIVDPGPNGFHAPLKLPVPLLFPQIFSTDMANWKSVAGPHIVRNIFTGDIFPPGYVTKPGGTPADTYTPAAYPGAGHDTDDKHHIYYFPGDMFIRGTVHGQVLFVAEGNIYITGDLLKATELTYPGDSLKPSSSTAHQAILVTQGTVFINNQAWINGAQVTGPIVGTLTEKIQALVLAPNGAFQAVNYGTDDNAYLNYHSHLRLEYLGSMIVGQIGTDKESFSYVFGGPGSTNMRVYAYDSTLGAFAPPYLPALAEIYCVLEEVTQTPGLYN